MNSGWFKTYRSICDSAVFQDPKVLKLWIYILANAEYKDYTTITNGGIVSVKKGQLITGRKKLSLETDFSEEQIRRMLKILSDLGNIEIKTTNKYSVITVVNWGKYQDDSENSTNKQPTNNQQITNKQPTDNQQTTTIEEYKEYIEFKEGVEDTRVCENDYDPFTAPTSPTLPEIRTFCLDRDSIVDPARFYNYYSRVGWDKCGDWQVKIEEWENNSFANGDRERVEKLKNYRSFENTDKQVIDLEIFDEAIPNYGG